MKHTIIIRSAAVCILFIAGACGARCQVKTDYDRYMDTIQEKSILYRGKEAPQYNFLYNGNPYWDGERFKTGDMMFNEKEYHGLPMRIDAASHELTINLEGTSRAVTVETQAVPWCTLEDVKYVNLKHMGIEGAEDGFYEVIKEDGPMVIRLVTKSLASSYQPQNDRGIGYYDPEYKDKVFDYFEQKVHYYLVKDGKLSHISKRKALKYAAQK